MDGSEANSDAAQNEGSYDSDASGSYSGTEEIGRDCWITSDQNANCGASFDFDWSGAESSAGSTEFQGDYWMASTEATRGYGINVRREPCTSSFILGTVYPGDTVLATRERSGSWMKLVDWDGKGDCWIFRGDEDDLFEFVSASNASAASV